MFIKIINHSEKVAIQKGSPHTICYECRRYVLEKAESDAVVRIIIDVGEQEERAIEINKDCHTIIIMNHEGKTVDKYCW